MVRFDPQWASRELAGQSLLRLIDRFVRGGERTRSPAAAIEGLVIESFQDEPWFDDVSEALALFVPGGSSPYLDESALARELGAVAANLTATLQNTPNDDPDSPRRASPSTR